MGKNGVRRIAELNLENAFYLRAALSSFKEIEILTNGSIFNEFTVRFKKSAQKISELLFKKGIAGGLTLERYYPELKDALIICATETKSKDDLDKFVQALKEAL